MTQWVDNVVELLTSGAFVALLLGGVGIAVFAGPLRRRIASLIKVGIMGDTLQAEFAALEQGVANVATPENREAIEEMIKQASTIGYNMRADGVPEPPTWEIVWREGKPEITISVETLGTALAAIERRRRPMAPNEEFWARRLWGPNRDQDASGTVDP